RFRDFEISRFRDFEISRFRDFEISRFIILSLEGESAIKPPREDQNRDVAILVVGDVAIDATKAKMANAHFILVSAMYKSGAKATMTIRS
ncbi:MAG: hypothetical protein MR215_05650, partial [Bacteroidales bacterium]|nr:hypothetical protein [Bacteroidales bacterium]